ncbi:MAG: hypothetical protein AAF266_01250 [Planctomycetota bacterium]
MPRYSAAALLVLFSLIGPLEPIGAQTIDWTGGGTTNSWAEKANWTGNNVPDTSGETARFNVAGGFPVELPGNFTINDLIALNGLPQLRPQSGAGPTLTVSDDLIANGGGFFLSTPGDEKLILDINDELRIDGGGAFTADTSGGDGTIGITIGDLRLADVGSGSGDLNLMGPGTTLDQTGFSIINLGQDGPAQFTLSDRARATFSAPLQLSNFADANTTATVLVDSGTRLTLGLLQIATGGVNSGVSGGVTVSGTNSRITTSSGTTIGGTSLPVGNLTVSNSGRFDSGGLLMVNASGILNVDGGTLNAVAGLNAGAGTLNHAGGSINVTGGAFVPVDDSVASEYAIDGAGIPEVVIGAGSDLTLGTALRVGKTSGGALRAEGGGDVNINFSAYVGDQAGGNGTLTVSGAGSTFVSTNLNVGDEGNGVMRIESGGFADVFDLDLGFDEDSYGELVVTGTGSRLLTEFDSFFGGGTVQVARRGDGRLEVTDSGIVDAGSLLIASNSFGPTTQTGDVIVDNGEINLTRGLFAGFNGTANIDVSNGGSIVVTDDTSLGPNATITIGTGLVDSGGSFQTGGFADRGGRFVLRRGDLIVTDADQKLLVEPSQVSISGVVIEGDEDFPTSILSGTSITLAGPVIVAPAASLSISGQLSAGGLQLATGGFMGTPFFSTLTIDGPVATAVGSRLSVTGVTTMGDPTARNGVIIGGELLLGSNDLTLLDANDVVFDSGAFVSLSTTSTEVFADNGLTIDFGANVVGEGSLVTPDDPTKPLTNNGHIAGDSPAHPITLTGYVKGVGTCDNCVITGTDAPGFSPATVVRGSVAYRGVLEIEIGGTGSGDFDRLKHLLGAGIADLGGELRVVLIDDYQLAAGDEIEFLTATGVTGAFDTETLPTLGGGLDTQLVYGADSVTLAVIGVQGDYNYDGVVDAADYTVWRDADGTTGIGLAADGDLDGDVDADDHAVWVANYGSNAVVATAVPVPAAAVLTAITLASSMAASRRRIP